MAPDSILPNQLSLPIINTPHWQLNSLVNDLQTERISIDRFLVWWNLSTHVRLSNLEWMLIFFLDLCRKEGVFVYANIRVCTIFQKEV